MNSDNGKLAIEKADKYSNVITGLSGVANILGGGALTSTSAKLAGKLGLDVIKEGGKIVVKDTAKKKLIDFTASTSAEMAGEILASKAVGDELSTGELILELATAPIEAGTDVATSRISSLKQKFKKDTNQQIHTNEQVNTKIKTNDNQSNFSETLIARSTAELTPQEAVEKKAFLERQLQKETLSQEQKTEIASELERINSVSNEASILKEDVSISPTTNNITEETTTTSKLFDETPEANFTPKNIKREDVNALMPFNIQGNKSKLLAESIGDLVENTANNSKRVIDAFGGSATYTHYLKNKGYEGEVVLNELEPLRHITHKQIKKNKEGVVDEVKKTVQDLSNFTKPINEGSVWDNEAQNRKKQVTQYFRERMQKLALPDQNFDSLAESGNPVEMTDSPETAGLYLVMQNQAFNFMPIQAEIGKLSKNFKLPGFGVISKESGKIGFFNRGKQQTFNPEKFILPAGERLKNVDIQRKNGWDILKNDAKEGDFILVDTSYLNKGNTKTTNYQRLTQENAVPDVYKRKINENVLTAWDKGAKMMITNNWNEDVASFLKSKGFTILKGQRQGASSHRQQRQESGRELIAINFDPNTGRVNQRRADVALQSPRRNVEQSQLRGSETTGEVGLGRTAQGINEQSEGRSGISKRDGTSGQVDDTKASAILNPKQRNDYIKSVNDYLSGTGNIDKVGEISIPTTSKASVDITKIQTQDSQTKKPISNYESKIDIALNEVKNLRNKIKTKVESIKDIKSNIQEFIKLRRAEIDLKAFETNIISESLEKNLSKSERELIPFLMEKTDVPEKLERKDLQDLYQNKEQRNKLEKTAVVIKEHFDKSWQHILNNSDKLTANQIENYVTHIWDIPKNKKPDAISLFATRNKFLKKRYIETLKEGIEKHGLKPKVLDIAEIIRIHDNITNKVIANNNFIESIKKLTNDGEKVLIRSDKAPEGWVSINHPALKAKLVIPKDAKTSEKVSPELNNILNELGIKIGRRISPKVFGKEVPVEGLYSSEKKEIRLQRFFSSKTIAHEIGHYIDEKLELGDNFRKQYDKIGRAHV